MAAIAATRKKIGARSIEVKWETLTSADSGASAEVKGHPDRTVQVSGTPSGATITLQGSVDGTNFVTLTDNLGLDIVFVNTTGLKVLAQAPRYMQITNSGGDGSTDIDITMLCNAAGL